MPIYEYVCQACGEEFEAIQKFSDPPLKKHGCAPRSPVKRKISLNAFQLKGGGWYNEGYAKGKGDSSNGDGAKVDGAKGEGAKGKGSSDSKTAGSGDSASSGGSSSSDSATAPKTESKPSGSSASS